METSTPMQQQYHQIKSRYRDCILFFRLGDFYEMFYEDAQKASRLLDLVLTSRGAEKSGKAPMCGIPYHAADQYITKLIKKGLKVAICEQMEDPALAKGIVKRDVIRVITSGTYIDEQSPQPRYLISLSTDNKIYGLALSDTTGGFIKTNEFSDIRKIIETISRLPVYECIFPAGQEALIKDLFKHPLLKIRPVTLSPFEDWGFNPTMAQKTLCEHFSTHNLKGFGIDGKTQAISSAGALLEYLKQMNKQPMRHIDKLSLYLNDQCAFISPAACQGLELETLLKTIDKTITSLGKRKLNEWLYQPLKDLRDIEERQDAVTQLKNQRSILEDIHGLFRNIPDIEKNLSRISCGYMSARDILALRNTLELVPDIQKTVSPLSAVNSLFALEDIPQLRTKLCLAVNPDIPLSNPDGKIIQKGFHQELDSLRDIQDNGRQWLKDLQEKEIKRTRINSLKIGYNQVFGYYIEVTKANLNLVPENYIRKQTLVNAERFITPELKEFEEKILTAEQKILKIETEILKELQKEILDHSFALHNLSTSLATIDGLYSLANLALEPNYIKPEITEDSEITIKDGRHPVVEKMALEPFVPNDTLLDCDKNHLHIITGPNMSGKSTYIRQVAILTIMAQMGSYIPATTAKIGIVDKIFTRIGAHDDIAKGQSTFMVEMSETADILNNLSERSLVILDEIGRGTSTFDGLSLAWALSENLQKKKVRTLFATHFHELTALAEEYEGVVNYNVAVKEWNDEVIFLHKIVPGGTDDSYGIYVAKLAGIPKDVIRRSEQILAHLEMQSNLKENILGKFPKEIQYSLFENENAILMKKIREVLEAMDVNALTPLEALNKIHRLKQIIEEKK